MHSARLLEFLDGVTIAVPNGESKTTITQQKSDGRIALEGCPRRRAW
jgi:hypothetical protein